MNSIVKLIRANKLNVKKYSLYLKDSDSIRKWGRTDRLEAYLPWHPEIIQHLTFNFSMRCLTACFERNNSMD